MTETLSPQACWQAACQRDWLVGVERQNLRTLVELRLAQLSAWKPQTQADSGSTLPKILLVEADPVAFIAGLMAALLQGCSVGLGNPAWGQQEWGQAWAQLQPDLVWGDADGLGAAKMTEVTPKTSQKIAGEIAEANHSLKVSPSPVLADAANPPLIWIPTGGSSGQIKFAIHTWSTLLASVQGFQAHFGLHAVHAYCVLPLFHVSGLMQILRSLITGGQVVVQPFRALQAGERVAIPPETYFLSLVPTQLQRLIDHGAVDWLHRFRAILLGGAPAWPTLLDQAQALKLPLALTYGMTETASQVATLFPAEFLAGRRSAGRCLPHATITIHREDGQPLAIGELGLLRIQTPSLAWGYLDGDQIGIGEGRTFQPDDLGYRDDQGYLHVVGRNSHTIITGGEKVFPVEVEAVIRSTGLVQDVCVVGVADGEWGQRVTAVWVMPEAGEAAHGENSAANSEPCPEKSPEKSPEVSSERIALQIAPLLSYYKQPKQWLRVNALPRNEQGKVNRLAVLAIAERQGKPMT